MAGLEIVVIHYIQQDHHSENFFACIFLSEFQGQFMTNNASILKILSRLFVIRNNTCFCVNIPAGRKGKQRLIRQKVLIWLFGHSLLGFKDKEIINFYSKQVGFTFKKNGVKITFQAYTDLY